MLQSMPVFIFANQAGLDMLETTLVALQDITLDKIFDESGRKALCADFAKLMQQVTYILLVCILLKLLCLKRGKPQKDVKVDCEFQAAEISDIFIRDLPTCRLASVCRQWADMSHTNKPLHGKFLLLKITLSTVLLSLS